MANFLGQPATMPAAAPGYFRYPADPDATCSGTVGGGAGGLVATIECHNASFLSTWWSTLAPAPTATQFLEPGNETKAFPPAATS